MTDPIKRLEAALRQLGRGHAPPLHWEAGVLDVVDPQRQAAPALRSRPPAEPVPSAAPEFVAVGSSVTLRGRRRWWPRLAQLAVLGAAAAALVVWLAQPDLPREEVSIAASWEPGPAVTRGGEPKVGDVVHVVATSAGGHADRRAIWVYRRDSELVAVCAVGEGWPPAQPCRQIGDQFALDFVPRAAGAYSFVAATSAAPLPAPQGSFDADVAAAVQAGARTRVQRFDVQ